MPGNPSKVSAFGRLWWLAAGIAIALMLATGATLWHLREAAIDGASNDLRLLSLALASELDRGIQDVTEGFRAVATEVAQGRLDPGADGSTDALETRAQLMPLVSSLWLVGSDGRVLSASDAARPPDLRMFSPPLDQLAADQISVSRPYVDSKTGVAAVAMAFRFRAPQGDGWIIGELPAAELLGAFSAAAPTGDVRMAVYRGDGVRLAGEIVDRPVIADDSLARRLATTEAVQVRSVRNGGGARLVAVQRGARLGLEIVLTRDLDAALASWNVMAVSATAGLVLTLAILAWAIVLLQGAERRRLMSERRYQAQLAHASKLESLGTLAGGVAHDFNSVLAAIVGFGEMAQDAAPAGSAQQRHLEKVLQAALRGRELVARVLTFSRSGAREENAFSLQSVVAEVVAMLAASTPPGIRLGSVLDAEGRLVWGESTQAFEAVMNLCTNALAASPSGGAVIVRLEPIRLRSSSVFSHSRLPPGDYLRLSVEDQGTGIPPEHMEHLFEPFFTTRAASGGTGMGLAVVHGVLAEIGGGVDVSSTPEGGACFALYFPEHRTHAGGVASPTQPASNAAGKHLLVLDDEPSLVAMSTELLRGLGYEPAGFVDAAAALAAVVADPHRFEAVITDEMMPGTTGTQFAEQLRTAGIAVPVLLVTGYGGALLAARATRAGVTRILHKPLQRVELATALAEILA